MLGCFMSIFSASSDCDRPAARRKEESGRKPGTGATQPATDRQARRRRALGQRQWQAPGQALRLGRPGRCPGRAVYGNGFRDSLQSGDPGFRRSSQTSRQTRQGGHRCLHAQTADHHECHNQRQYPLGPEKRLTLDTVAPASDNRFRRVPAPSRRHRWLPARNSNARLPQPDRHRAPSQPSQPEPASLQPASRNTRSMWRVTFFDSLSLSGHPLNNALLRRSLPQLPVAARRRWVGGAQPA